MKAREKQASFQFCVVGGGMNGLIAAIAAARHGARTALIQERPVFGGNASSEIRMHICGASADETKPNAEEGGILREILLSNKAVNRYFNFSTWDRVLFEASREKNLTVFLNTTMHDAACENGRVQSIRCWQMTTETEWTISADIFADCTGNGTLAYFAGVPFRTGSEGKAEFNEPHAPAEPDDHRMGNTLLFKAVNRGEPVPFTPPKTARHFTEEQLRYRKHADLIGPQLEEKADALIESVDKKALALMTDSYCMDYGYWWIEINGDKGDIIEQFEDIRDELFNCIYGVWDHIKNGGNHGAANYDLEWVGMLPGMRESRRMEGDYILNENDLLENRVFDDAVAYGGWAVDNHIEHGLFDFDRMPSEIYPFDGLYTIPYRSYLAKNTENLFISGRSLSASKLAMASTRVMGTCAVGGQAIGTAAALALAGGTSIRGIDIHELQQTLLKDDCYIPGFKNEDPADLALTAAVSADSEKEPAVNVINGVSRSEGENSNCWKADGPQGTLTLKLSECKAVSEVRLVFDPNLSKSIKLTLSSVRATEQVKSTPPELVRDYDVVLLKDGKETARRSIRGNLQRLNVVPFESILCDTVRVETLATHGAPDAVIFEVRIY